MTVKTEGRHAAEFIMSEAAGMRSRENVTLLDGETILAGQVLGIVTVSGKYAAFDDTAADGTEDAAAIAIYPASPSGADEEIAIIARDAEVNGNILTWPGTTDATEKAAAIAQLAALGIIVR